MALSSWFVDERSVDIEEPIAEDLENLEQANTTAHSTGPLQPPPKVLKYASPYEKDQTDNLISTEKALLHFNNIMNYCLCKPQCITTTEHFPLAQSFASFTEDEKNNLVRAMMLCLCAHHGQANELMASDSVKAQSKRDKQRRLSSSSYSSTSYAMRGKWVCQFGLAAIVQLNPQTRYAAANAIAFPTGRGSEDESPLQWLSSDVRRQAVQDLYRKERKEIMEAAAVRNAAVRKPDAPLSKSGFLKVWGSYYPTLRILKSGSDFCDQCTTFSNSARTTTNMDLRETLLAARRQHRVEALAQFTVYRTIQTTAENAPATNPIHLIFDFAEKILLPHLLRQPGQLHFVTSLQFDIFGVYSSTMSTCYVYGLPGGNWPGNKTCNEVASMLNHAGKQHRVSGVVTESHKHLKLHADNCSGQNKNWFMVWYLLWRVCMKYEDEITLRFLLAGHTKNRCDAAFGLVKRRLKKFDVFSPGDMMKILEESSTSNKAVNAKDVSWFNWKELLRQFYKVPTDFKLSTYHVFRFSHVNPEIVMVKHFSSDASWLSFKLTKRSVSSD
ncbi:hypothetical protein BWQ96_05033 [Gracilariopsis chorda]|uniref:DUF7869 domain-containing protein n=1 Tax=Gracilariopsis chorda TaxID=448386 RepID=A0A2V3ISV5_9FLOR|nr:hypothetical protein BWQ96_05033 [Gracilariopsis chorda]|eukprot:PXF45203.1 hypothetical protein BWQ96_05033 [Gracilariopsis chorda]